MPRIKFLNTEIDNLTMQEALNEVEKLILQKKNAYVVTPNTDHIVQLEKNSELAKAYKNASLILTDGKPLVWISKLFCHPIKEKVSGSDLFFLLCGLSAKKGYSMFLLGGKEGIAEKASFNLRTQFPNLKIVGTYSPSFGFEHNPEETDTIIKLIKNSKPDILVVALGCPKQEIFMYHYSNKLCVPISFGLGATIDYAAGTVRRAPRWMSDNGLEWLYRIFQDPKRLVNRYFRDFFQIHKIIRKYR